MGSVISLDNIWLQILYWHFSNMAKNYYNKIARMVRDLEKNSEDLIWLKLPRTIRNLTQNIYPSHDLGRSVLDPIAEHFNWNYSIALIVKDIWNLNSISFKVLYGLEGR